MTIIVKNVSKVFKVPVKKENTTFLSKVKEVFYREWTTKKALRKINFEIKQGEFVGYVGPNGAGKSTTIKILTGIVSPSEGSVSVLNMNPHKDRYKYTYNIGVVFGQRRLLQYDLPVQDSFDLYRSIYELNKDEYTKRLKYFTKILKLDRYLHIPVRKLSLGERMRCEIAASLLHKPKIVFLDEPTIGLDAVAKEEIRSFLREINEKDNTTIILTTHDMDDIEELCNRIILIDKGKIAYDGPIDKLKKKVMNHKTIDVEYVKINNKIMYNTLFKDKKIKILYEGKNLMQLQVDISTSNITSVIKKLFLCLEIIDVSVHEPRLEHIMKEVYRSRKKLM